MFSSEYGFIIDYNSECSIEEILYFGDYEYLFLDEIIDEDIIQISKLIGIKIPEYYVKILKSIFDKDRYLEINNYLFDTHSLTYDCMVLIHFLLLRIQKKCMIFIANCPYFWKKI